MLRLTILAGLCTLLCLGAADARSCTCLPPPTPTEMLEMSDLVVAGRVVTVSDHTEEFYLAVILETHAVWKSPLVLPSYTLITASDGAACGYHFEVGEEYLVYADAEGGGSYFTHLCGRNRNLAAADEDLEELGPPMVVPARESGFGMIKARFGQR